MPSIHVAMARSLGRRSVLDVLAAALEPVVVARRGVSEVESSITDVKTAFSSWDNCMKAVFCKWPVIAVIIVGALFLISIVWCIARCACCGLSCCCECCYCLKCCGECCGCCDPPRRKQAKYLDAPFVPPDQGYRSEAPMAAGALPYSGNGNHNANANNGPFNAKAPVYEAPQFANFDVSKKHHEEEDADALPAMPSWEGASQKKVMLVEEELVEMDDLKKPEGPGSASRAASVSPAGYGGGGVGVGPGQGRPYNGNGATLPMGGAMNHPAVSNGYMAAGAIPAGAGGASPYSQGYNGGMNGNGMGMGNSMGNSMGMGNGMSSPVNGNGEYGYGANMGRDGPSPRPYNQQPGYGAGPSPQQSGGYGASPPPQQPGYGASPPPQQPGYGRNIMPGGPGGNFDEQRRNGTGTPRTQPGYDMDMDRRTPRLPDLSGSAPGYGGGGPGSPPDGPGMSGGGPTNASSPYGSGPNGSGPRPYGGGPGARQSPMSSPVNGRQMMSSPANGGPMSSPVNGRPNMPSPVNGRPMMNNRLPPQRQYTPGPGSGNINNGMGGPPTNMPSAGGFDFGSDYSRPQDLNGNGNGRPYELAQSTSPPPLVHPQPQQAAPYGGYRPYNQPGQERW